MQKRIKFYIHLLNNYLKTVHLYKVVKYIFFSFPTSIIWQYLPNYGNSGVLNCKTDYLNQSCRRKYHSHNFNSLSLIFFSSENLLVDVLSFPKIHSQIKIHLHIYVYIEKKNNVLVFQLMDLTSLNFNN